MSRVYTIIHICPNNVTIHGATLCVSVTNVKLIFSNGYTSWSRMCVKFAQNEQIHQSSNDEDYVALLSTFGLLCKVSAFVISHGNVHSTISAGC